MSGYDNVVTGKLKLKGKALDVKATGIKKKKKQKKDYEQIPQAVENELSEKQLADLNNEDAAKTFGDESSTRWYDHLTPAERRYIEQREKIDSKKLVKTSNKSHRDRIQDFNQYLANMSEHYDIPKVGPG
ncbi:hypothetical protein F511_04579 [Dorcoceras hygrometricum]|uniref:Uncharacterized protein n=1 Tax=Dorcoceras hygrometricum TaxID=472368 RepID=A0A2Z7B260_9LAMI|nr:hypothetical protein F511_04579 [Dorcoceras hygrometricum]